jgi:hypothetical protein
MDAFVQKLGRNLLLVEPEVAPDRPCRLFGHPQLPFGILRKIYYCSLLVINYGFRTDCISKYQETAKSSRFSLGSYNWDQYVYD